MVAAAQSGHHLVMHHPEQLQQHLVTRSEWLEQGDRICLDRFQF